MGALIGGVYAAGKLEEFREWMKTVDKGTNCYCINYVEKWEDGQQHFEEIEIVCQKLENGPVAYDNPWK
jgi:predicted acylesterase/phospholipase RssA